jgi:hypothetical protein
MEQHNAFRMLSSGLVKIDCAIEYGLMDEFLSAWCVSAQIGNAQGEKNGKDTHEHWYLFHTHLKKV